MSRRIGVVQHARVKGGCVCVCVCEREREREREPHAGTNHRGTRYLHARTHARLYEHLHSQMQTVFTLRGAWIVRGLVARLPGIRVAPPRVAHARPSRWPQRSGGSKPAVVLGGGRFGKRDANPAAVRRRRVAATATAAAVAHHSTSCSLHYNGFGGSIAMSAEQQQRRQEKHRWRCHCSFTFLKNTCVCVCVCVCVCYTGERMPVLQDATQADRSFAVLRTGTILQQIRRERTIRKSRLLLAIYFPPSQI